MADPTRLPLSAAQRGVWFAHQLDATGQEFNCAQYLAIDGPLELSLLSAAWNALRGEADVLRISAISTEDGLWQLVDPPGDVELPLIDLGRAEDPEAAARRWMRDDLTRPVSLTRAPISTVAILRVGPDRHLFYYRLHHVIVDGYSVHEIGRRLADIYTALAGGRPYAERGIPFAPLATLLDEDVAYRSGAAFARDRGYWTECFADEPDSTQLPGLPVADPPLRLSATATVDQARIRRWERAAADAGVTWQILFLATVAAYTYRVTGHADVIIGMPVSGRRTAAARRTPGMATNSVALRVRVGGEQSLNQLIPQVADVVRAALRHERYRPEDLRRDLGLEGSGRAFIGPMVNFLAHDESLRLGPLRATTHNLASGPIVDFSVSVGGTTGDRTSLVFEGNPQRHSPDGFHAHADRLTAFLNVVVAEPDRPLGGLDLLLPAERHDLLAVRNATDHPVRAGTIADLVAQQAARRPEAVAVVSGDRSLTYADLDRWADQLAAELAGAGLGPEEFAALRLPRSPELIVAMLAVARTGAAYAPIDPEYPDERIRYLLADIAPKCIVDAVAPSRPERVAPQTRPVDPACPAYVIHTSGSTGRPKGVVVPHAAVENFVLDRIRRFGVDASSRVLQLVSPSFDVATGDIWPVLAAGGCLVLAPEHRSVTPESLLALLDGEHITHAAIPPALLAKLPAADLPRLAVLITGGEAADPDTIRRWAAGRRLINEYGVTEATVTSTVAALRAESPAVIGRPIGNVRVHVLDSRGELMPDGSTGELYLTGAGVARGYLRRPELTAERFLPCPYGPPGTRMYATGDRVRWRAGELEYRGRTDNQIKIRGFRVELGEVEAALGAHPRVRAAAVLAREDQPGRKRLVGYAEPVSAPGPTSAELRAFLARSLPNHMVPAVVVVLESLPLTPHGKVDRRALPEPETGSSAGGQEPADPREEILCALFAEALGLERVGVRDSFFDLGGDSIMVFPLVSSAAEHGLEITARDVFQHPTVAGLAPVARAVAGTGQDGVDVAVALTPEQHDAIARAHPGMTEVLPISPLQEGFLFLATVAGTRERDAYVSQIHVDLAGPVDPAGLRAAGQALLDRHPNLRAAFLHDGLPVPVQVIHGTAELPWSEVVLAAHDDQEREDEARRVAAAERDRGFAMDAPPLLRLSLIRLAGDRYRMVLTAHHILWDGWSTSILLRELFTRYAGGEPPEVTPYRRYLGWLAGRDRDESRRAWSAALAGLERPTLVAPGFVGGSRQQQLRHELSVEATAALTAWARARGLTTNTVLEGAWGLLLARLTGTDDVIFGSSVSGRPAELPGVENVVGLLTNTIPVRVRFRGQESREELLTRLQAEQAELIPHHYLGLADVQRQSTVGPALFDTAIMFVNYSFDAADWTAALGDVKLTGFDVTDDTHYPLRLAVVPGPRLHLRLGYHPDGFGAVEAENLLAALVDTLDTLVGGAPR